MANFELPEYTEDRECQTLITFGYQGTDKTSIILKAAQDAFLEMSYTVNVSLQAVELRDDKIQDLVGGVVREIVEDKSGCFRIQNLATCSMQNTTAGLKMIYKFLLKRKGHVILTLISDSTSHTFVDLASPTQDQRDTNKSLSTFD